MQILRYRGTDERTNERTDKRDSLGLNRLIAERPKIFKAAVEPFLLYGSETWTLSKKLEKRLGGTYTRLLMRVQNISWKSHPTKVCIYNTLPPVLLVIAAEQNKRSFLIFSCGNPFLETREDVN